MSKESIGAPSPDDRTDWPRVKSMTDAEIVYDDDSPATTESDWDGAVLRQSGVEIGQVRRHGHQKTPVTEQVTIRFDVDVIAALRATGRGWQARVNEVMREWVKTHLSGGHR